MLWPNPDGGPSGLPEKPDGWPSGLPEKADGGPSGLPEKADGGPLGLPEELGSGPLGLAQKAGGGPLGLPEKTAYREKKDSTMLTSHQAKVHGYRCSPFLCLAFGRNCFLHSHSSLLDISLKSFLNFSIQNAHCSHINVTKIKLYVADMGTSLSCLVRFMEGRTILLLTNI